jgi:uncharacterized membrane protein YqjE
MEIKIIKSRLKRVKYIMIRQKEELTRLEFLLKIFISLIILSIIYLILFAFRDSSFLFIEFSSTVRGGILIISILSIIWILEYFGKKSRRSEGDGKTAPSKKTI